MPRYLMFKNENKKEYFNKTFNMISKQNKEIFNEFKDIKFKLKECKK